MARRITRDASRQPSGACPAFSVHTLLASHVFFAADPHPSNDSRSKLHALSIPLLPPPPRKSLGRHQFLTPIIARDAMAQINEEHQNEHRPCSSFITRQAVNSSPVSRWSQLVVRIPDNMLRRYAERRTSTGASTDDPSSLFSVMPLIITMRARYRMARYELTLNGGV